MLEISRLDNNKRAPLDTAAFNAFRSTIRGDVLLPDHPEYDGQRRIFNRMIDKRPALIVRCSGVADVIQCVNFAREHELLTAVRGGGHGVAGNAVCDNGLMIDLSRLNSVRVDPREKMVWVQGGAALGDVDHETAAVGYVTPAGVVSTTGVAGLTTGGGYGWLRGRLGMSIDNLRVVDIVTADGTLRQASETEHEDLFWAIRGGGGNFGIVTTFGFEIHEFSGDVMLCSPVYAAENAVEVMKGWRSIMQNAPDDFTTVFYWWQIPQDPGFPSEFHGMEVVIPFGVWSGPIAAGEAFVQPLRELGPVLFDMSGPQKFTDVQTMFDHHLPYGELYSYWKALYLTELSDEMIETLVRQCRERPSSDCPFVLHDLRGESSRVNPDSMAFSARHWKYMMEYNSSWASDEQTDEVVAWTRKAWSEMREKHSQHGGGYLNMCNYDEYGESLVQETYHGKYSRLQQIKKKYDPGNLFRLNPNILPAQ